MDALLDFFCFDLMDFDCKHPVFPKNAVYFFMQRADISIPQDHIPSFSDAYLQRLGVPSDFESVNFYRDFTRLINSRTITADVREGIIKFFEISFLPDPAIDILCFEAFRPSTTFKRTQPDQAPSCTVKAFSPMKANSPKKGKA